MESSRLLEPGDAISADLRDSKTWHTWREVLGEPLGSMLAKASFEFDEPEDAIVLLFPHSLFSQADSFLEWLMTALTDFYGPRWTDFLMAKGFPNAATAMYQPEEVEAFLRNIDSPIPRHLVVPRIRVEFMPPMELAQ
jgi:hypothetical protein